MMKLSAFNRRPSKKPLLIFAGVVVACVVASIGGWIIVSQRATADYHSRLSAYVTDTKKSLASIASDFKGLAKTGESTKTSDALGRLADKLSQQARNIPSLPEAWGVQLTPQEDSVKRSDFAEHLNQLSGDVKAAQDLLAYEHQTATILQEVITKTGPDATQQKALADAWQNMITKLKAIKPPGAATSAHNQLITTTSAMQAVLATLPDLYTKKDVNGFAAKQKEIETHIIEIRALGNIIADLGVKQDKIIVRDYAALGELLK